MDWFNNIEGLSPFQEAFKEISLDSMEKDYLQKVDISDQFDLFKNRLAELSDCKGMAEKDILEQLDPSVEEAYLAKEYEQLSDQVELSKEDYLSIKKCAWSHDLDISIHDGEVQLRDVDGKTIISLSPENRTGEALIGEHRFHRSYNKMTGLQRGEFRLPDYDIKDVYNVFGPNSKWVGGYKTVEIQGNRYDIPIGIKEESYHGMAVRLYGSPDFSEYAVGTVSIEADAVVRESPSHKIEATTKLAQNFMEGKYPEGTFTPQQEAELREVAAGKQKQTISGLTPHHVGNAEMQFVPTEIHKKVTHLGGSWLMNEKNYFNVMDSGQLEKIQRAKFSPAELAYVDEIVPEHKVDLLIARIDELNQCEPPKAIDSDPKMADLIEPLIDEIDITYLEAPQDSLQIESIAGQMTDMEGLDFREWKELSLRGRMDVLEQVEERVADIAHRPACELEVKELGAGQLGYYSNGENKITLNESYVQSNSIADYREVLDTLIHEGRHAYQDYNLHVREVHPRQGDITNWKLNEFGHGYQDVKHCGFQAYEMQPLESDARAFAEDVLQTYQNKLA